MSTTYQAVAIFGLYFGSRAEAEQFVEKHDIEYDSDSIEINWLGIECMNAWNGTVAILGIGMELGDTFETYRAIWDSKVPKTDREPHGILEVRIN